MKEVTCPHCGSVGKPGKAWTWTSTFHLLWPAALWLIASHFSAQFHDPLFPNVWDTILVIATYIGPPAGLVLALLSTRDTCGNCGSPYVVEQDPAAETPHPTAE